MTTIAVVIAWFVFMAYLMHSTSKPPPPTEQEKASTVKAEARKAKAIETTKLGKKRAVRNVTAKAESVIAEIPKGQLRLVPKATT